jgi:hypothetical protein
MVSALHIITAALAAAFLMGLLKEQQRGLAFGITLVTLALMSWLSAGWLWTFASTDTAAVEIFTAGTEPPFAINLRIGLAEAALTLLINLTGLFSALALKDTLLALGRRAMAVWLVAVWLVQQRAQLRRTVLALFGLSWSVCLAVGVVSSDIAKLKSLVGRYTLEETEGLARECLMLTTAEAIKDRLEQCRSMH